jgi:hypothetical protein
MWHVIGLKLPDAIGIALSALAIAGLLLMLTAHRGLSKAVAYTIGWMFTLAGVVTLTAMVGQAVLQRLGQAALTWIAAIEILFGAGQIYLGILNFWKARKNPSNVEVPGWLRTIDKMPPGSAFAFGALMIVFNGKNLPLSIAAGASFIGARLQGEQLAVAIFVFTLVGSFTIFGPLLLTLVASRRSARFLAATRDWLIANNVIILTLVFVIMGAKLIWSGVGTLLSG